ncbi:MAG: hypothetical protein ABFS34_14950 [Gemmatimonadota bacterium]
MSAEREYRLAPARVVRALRSRARALLLVGAVGGLLGAFVTVLRPATYLSTASFMPQESNPNLSRISSMAQQFGISLPVDASPRSPAFYAALIQSRAVLEPVARGAVVADSDGRAVEFDLFEQFGIDRERPDRAEAALVDALRDAIGVRVERESGLLELEVASRDPVLSRGLALRVLAAVDTFDMAVRRSEAAAERAFAGERLAALRGELEAAEDKLRTFLAENRQFRNSPQLSFQHERLQREVVMRQDLVSSIAQSYEQARIEEVRSTPVITVVESPNLPMDPAGLSALMAGLLAAVIAGAFAAMAVIAVEYREALTSFYAGPRT